MKNTYRQKEFKAMRAAGWRFVKCHRKKSLANKTAKNILRKYYKRTTRGVMEAKIIKPDKMHCVFKRLTK